MSEDVNIRLTYRHAYPTMKEGMHAASRLINRRGPSVRRLGYVLLAGSATIVVLISAVIPAALGLGPEVVLFSFCAYLAATALLWAYWANYVGAVARDMLRTSLYQDDIEMELSKDGVSIRTTNTRCWLAWTAVEEIVDLKSGLGLFSGCCIYPIPDDALVSSMNREALRKRISAWREATQ